MNGRDRFERKRLLSNLGSEIEKEILRKLKFDEKGGVKSAVNDVMRGVKVSDARPIEKYNSVLVQKLDISTHAGKTREIEKPIPLFRECCKPGSEYEFTITLDKEMLKLANVKSIDTVIKCSKAYARRGLALQKEVFAEYYPNEFEEAKEADFFLGGGTGFLQKSLWFSICSDKNKGMEMLKLYLDDNFHIHRHKQLDREISPRTLKLAEVREKQLMGMCSLKEVQL
jgi:CRISPR-associated protein Csm5